MATIKTGDLIAKFQYALDNQWGYIMGQTCTKWSQSDQNAKVNYMKTNFGTDWKNNDKAQNNSSYTAALYGSKWIGHYVTDCSGLFAWAFKALGGYMYHGSNTMWNKYCTAQGKLSAGKRTDGKELLPGTAVFVLTGTSDRSHVGLYIGNGTVIEASGTQKGVITTAITNNKWAEWGELKGVDYDIKTTSASTAAAVSTDNTLTKIVNDTKVALRETPSTRGKVMLRLDKGAKVTVVSDDDWTKISYNGKTGYMMSKFLS